MPKINIAILKSILIILLLFCVSESISYSQTITHTNVSGEFHGWSGNTLFKLTDGSYWLQADYAYWYHYAYNPEVIIYLDGSDYKFKLIDEDESVRVIKIDVIESRIDGDFKGWEGNTIFKLQNGQVWQQAQYSYHYHYSYCPEALIYQSNSGWMLQVDGDEIPVNRIQ